MQPGNDLRYPRGAAGKLEHRDVIGVDVPLDPLDDAACGGGRNGTAEILDPWVRGVGTEHQHLAQRGVVTGLLVREAHEVERRSGVDQVRHRPGSTTDLADFVGPVGGQRAHRYQAGFEHAVPGQHAFEAVGDLEQHRITGNQAEFGQACGELVAARIELGESHPPLGSDNGIVVRVGRSDLVEFLGDGAGAPQSGRPVAGNVFRGVRH